MICNRGDVILVRYPNSDLTTYKRRPTLVIQADGLDTGLSQKIVAMITSNVGRNGSTRVFVEKNSLLGKQMGILSDSVIIADNLSTIHEREIDKVIGRCGEISAVDQSLRCALSL
ncbi:MAG: type II toxin-antitoxin system PemK/MazF family toxin [Deltaproteobacteria bacterium]|nr:type II toxin-antitoxin system PemK/MazF family toxin [Deltaproteobacteria bacterium]